MCVMYVWTIPTYAKFQANRFENGFHVVQKLRKCPYVKFSNSFFFYQNMQQRKMKIAPLNSSSNLASQESVYGMDKNSEIVTFFHRDLA